MQRHHITFIALIKHIAKCDLPLLHGHNSNIYSEPLCLVQYCFKCMVWLRYMSGCLQCNLRPFVSVISVGLM